MASCDLLVSCLLVLQAHLAHQAPQIFHRPVRRRFRAALPVVLQGKWFALRRRQALQAPDSSSTSASATSSGDAGCCTSAWRALREKQAVEALALRAAAGASDSPTTNGHSNSAMRPRARCTSLVLTQCNLHLCAACTMQTGGVAVCARDCAAMSTSRAPSAQIALIPCVGT